MISSPLFSWDLQPAHYSQVIRTGHFLPSSAPPSIKRTGAGQHKTFISPFGVDLDPEPHHLGGPSMTVTTTQYPSNSSLCASTTLHSNIPFNRGPQPFTCVCRRTKPVDFQAISNGAPEVSPSEGLDINVANTRFWDLRLFPEN